MEITFNNFTDIFGNTVINNNTPFILMHSNELYKFLSVIHRNRSFTILGYKNKIIKEAFNNKNLSIDEFTPFGHIYLNNDDFKMNNIIFGNKRFIKTTKKYKFIDTIGLGSLWEPISDDPGYTSFGLVYTNSKNAPIIETGLIPKNFIYVASSSIPTNIFKLDYNLIGHISIGKKRLMINKLLNSPKLFKLFNIDNKYLTDVNNEIKTIDKSDDPNQIISYTAQGELVLNDKCITKKNNDIKLEKCSESTNQKWISKDNNNFSPLDDVNDLCINSDNSENISLKPCDSSTSDQDWNKENVSRTTNIKLPKYKGKTVILVESNNPWYINKNTTIPVNVDKNNDINNDLEYKQGDFKSHFNIDSSKADLGYGHSFASRQGKPCVENFEDTNTNTNIFIIICILVILLLLYRMKW